MALRISPSLLVLLLIEPLASSRAMLPLRRQVVDHVLHPREVGVASRAARRTSSARRRPSRLRSTSFMLKGGLAMMKSARRSGCCGAGVGAGRLLAEVEVHAADGHVHARPAARWWGWLPARRCESWPTYARRAPRRSARSARRSRRSRSRGRTPGPGRASSISTMSADDALGRVELAAALAGGNARIRRGSIRRRGRGCPWPSAIRA
jgi:hypothetical protein